MPPPRLPIILGHQVVGRVEAWGRARTSSASATASESPGSFRRAGSAATAGAARRTSAPITARPGATPMAVTPSAWRTPGICPRHPRNLHRQRGRTLLCAGAIGFRSLRLTRLENGQSLGLTGFGASAHLVLKLVRYRFPDTRIFVFARSETERAFALALGEAGPATTPSPPPSCSPPLSTPPPPGHRSSRRSGTSSLAAGWSSTRSARKWPTRRRCSRSTTPRTLAREGDQERRQRHPRRCPRVPAVRRRDPAGARCPGICPDRGQPGTPRAEDGERPGRQGPAHHVIRLCSRSDLERSHKMRSMIERGGLALNRPIIGHTESSPAGRFPLSCGYGCRTREFVWASSHADRTHRRPQRVFPHCYRPDSHPIRPRMRLSSSRSRT